jgi:hypothetical protein
MKVDEHHNVEEDGLMCGHASAILGFVTNT